MAMPPYNIASRNAIFGKIRRLSASNNAYQLPDFPTGDPNSVSCAGYIDSFYSYDLPAEFRNLKLKDIYTFTTIEGIDTYPFNSEQYTTIEMPCYCAKREIKLFTDPWSFFGVNYNWQQQQNFSYADGSPGPFTGFTQATPIIRSVNNIPTSIGTPNVAGVSQGSPMFAASRVMNILITTNVSLGNTLSVTDDGFGNLIDPVTGVNRGSIDYSSGAISVTFGSATTPGNPISIQYNPTTLNIPLSIMYFQDQLTLRPVPDRAYTIEMVAYRQPTQALLATSDGTGTPELNEWWEIIAIGAAKKVYEDRLDFDGVAMMDKMLRERYSVIRTRTYGQLGKQRVATIFADQLSNNYGTWGTGGGGIV